MYEMTASPLQVLVITIGSTTPVLFTQKGSPASLEVIDNLKIDSYSNFRDSKPDVLKAVFDFANIDKNASQFSYTRLLTVMSSFGMWQKKALPPTKILIVVEGVWQDALDRDAVTLVSSLILRDTDWKKYSLNQGVVTLLCSKSKNTLSRGGARAQQLMESGIDMIYDLARLTPGADLDTAGERLAAEARRPVSYTHLTLPTKA